MMKRQYVALRRLASPLARKAVLLRKWITPSTGLTLVVVGVAMLAVGFVAHMAQANAFRLLALCLIIGGIVVYVSAQKMASRY